MTTRRSDWKSVATRAAAETLTEKLRGVSSNWAQARQDYLALWQSHPEDVAALQRAVRRLEELDRSRRSLASKLHSAL